MPSKITNLASRVVFVSLNGGSTLRLSPGGTSDEIADVEIRNNSKVDKLQKLRLIAVEQIGELSSSPKPKTVKTK